MDRRTKYSLAKQPYGNYLLSIELSADGLGLSQIAPE
jgi:hypothetical protein